MRKYYCSLILTSLFPSLHGWSPSDAWPQWRGAERNGRGLGQLETKLNWSDSSPKLLWKSPELPSQDDGGFGSPVSDGRLVYLSIVWHRDEPSEERTVTSLVLRKLGARKINLPNDLVEQVEKERLNLSPRLRGSKLDKWIEQWLAQNLDQKQRMTQGSLLVSRFKQGKLAMPVDAIDRLFSIKDQVFPNQKALDDWIGKQGFSPELAEKISQGVPPTQRAADDVVVALNLRNGDFAWKTALPGLPTGRTSSSTPCLAKNKIFAIGGKRIFCLGIEKGDLIWETEIHQKGVASSPLYHEGKIYALIGGLQAYDAQSGDLLWENKEVSGNAASPVLWKNGKSTLIVCNSKKTVVGVDPTSGETRWKGPGGGSSTPVTYGDLLIVHGKPEEVGVIAYQAGQDKITEIWRFPKLTRRADSSPLVYDGKVFLMGAGMRLCLDLESGELLRKFPAKHDISSPVLLNGQILTYEINGSFLQLLDAEPDRLNDGQKFKIGALKCTSPSLLGSNLIIRHANGLSCFDLRGPAPR